MTDPTDRPVDPDAEPLDAGSLDAELDAAVRAALAQLPAPAMPADVWDRLAAALADEQAAPVAQQEAPTAFAPPDRPSPAPPADGDPADPVDTATVVSLGPRAERRADARRRRTRILGGLAAASAVVVLAGVALSALPGRSAAPSDTVAAAVADGAAPGAVDLVPALRVTETGTKYSQATFRRQVSDLLASDEVSAAMPQMAEAASAQAPAPEDLTVADPVGSSGFTASWSGLRACVAGLAGSARMQAIVVDRATYEGRDAGVVVLPTVQTAAAVDVWVVEPGCDTPDPKVLLFFRLPLGSG